MLIWILLRCKGNSFHCRESKPNSTVIQPVRQTELFCLTFFTHFILNPPKKLLRFISARNSTWAVCNVDGTVKVFGQNSKKYIQIYSPNIFVNLDFICWRLFPESENSGSGRFFLLLLLLIALTDVLKWLLYGKELLLTENNSIVTARASGFLALLLHSERPRGPLSSPVHT